MDTIFALSSGLLPSGIAIIRLSGPCVRNALVQFAGFIPKPRYMNFCTLRSSTGETLDKALIVYFTAPKSFTGEDCAEFHLHGGKAVVKRILEEIATIPGFRLAEPGEFVQRAFLAGKLDLTEAEGLADMINAETESQRRLAVIGSSGALAVLYRDWRNQLVKARALIEAEFDFPDEKDIPNSVSTHIWANIARLRDSILQHIRDGKRTEAMRDGLKIIIAGAPNAGKSSVMNRLAGRDIAIVTEEAGTTRDALEIRLVIDTLPVLIIDTAGLQDTENRIEKMSIDIAIARMKEANLVLLLDDMHNPQTVTLPEISATVWHIGNKLDLSSGDYNKWPIQFSAWTGEGWDNFLEQLTMFCREKIIEIGNVVPIRKRQIALLENGLSELNTALKADDSKLELRSEHLRFASNYLGRITGDINVEDLLDVIFSEFCIGK
ncbi:MAG: tRNA modification GTPase [Candidatus Tokpelaia sp. JSC188]|nr:MAG: tRNA modification GTPase [Candidatus Tokpelaia sp. JSC188]